MITYQAVKVLLIGFMSFIAVDLLWIGFLMRDFYAKQLTGKLRMVDGAMALCWPAALIAWFLLVLGLYIFVLSHVASIWQALIYGAIYGFIVYGIYDATNYATLAGWPLEVVVADILWGSLINGLISLLMFYFKNI